MVNQLYTNDDKSDDCKETSKASSQALKVILVQNIETPEANNQNRALPLR